MIFFTMNPATRKTQDQFYNVDVFGNPANDVNFDWNHLDISIISLISQKILVQLVDFFISLMHYKKKCDNVSLGT